jgi:hypothetical protein
MTPASSIPDISTRSATAPYEPPPLPSPEFQAELARTRTDTVAHVPPQRTPLTGGEAAKALEDAWRTVVGGTPDRSTVAVLAAHWAHETGRGQAMLNFNFAGLKGAGPSGLGAAYRTREGWGKTEVHAVDTFRAYRTADEGAKDYVALLARRYPRAVEAARAGDASGFVGALKERGYFTGNEAAYRRNVTALSNEALTAGFDAMGAPSAASAGGAGSRERSFSPAMDFRAPSAVPFASSMAPGALSIDPASFYDEIARATLRIGGESPDDADPTNSIA